METAGNDFCEICILTSLKIKTAGKRNAPLRGRPGYFLRLSRTKMCFTWG